jgi:hypothetical protein
MGNGENMVPDDEGDERRRDFARRRHLFHEEGGEYNLTGRGWVVS